MSWNGLLKVWWERLGASHSSIEWIIESVVKRLGASHSSIAYEWEIWKAKNPIGLGFQIE